MELLLLVLVLGIAIAIGIALAPYVLPALGAVLIVALVFGVLVGGVWAIAYVSAASGTAAGVAGRWLSAHLNTWRHPVRDNFGLLLGPSNQPPSFLAHWVASVLVCVLLAGMVQRLPARPSILAPGATMADDLLIPLIFILPFALTVALRRFAGPAVQRFVGVLAEHFGLSLVVGVPFLVVSADYPELSSRVLVAYLSVLPVAWRIKYSLDVSELRRGRLIAVEVSA